MMKRTILAVCPFALALCAWIPSAHATSTANIVCYLWADQPSAASYTPSTTYSFNRPGGANKVTRSGPGSYTVTCGKVTSLSGPRGGHIQVSAYGGSANACNVVFWGGTPLSANVQCRSLVTGAPTDSFFDFLFVR
jgi:hypothetical protein